MPGPSAAAPCLLPDRFFHAVLRGSNENLKRLLAYHGRAVIEIETTVIELARCCDAKTDEKSQAHFVPQENKISKINTIAHEESRI